MLIILAVTLLAWAVVGGAVALWLVDTRYETARIWTGALVALACGPVTWLYVATLLLIALYCAASNHIRSI